MTPDTPRPQTSFHINRSIRVGAFISLLALIISLFGSAMSYMDRPNVSYDTSFINFDDHTFNNCIVVHRGGSNAVDLIVEVESGGNVPFVRELNVHGGEERHEVQESGIDETYGRILIPRLAETHVVVVTGVTEVPTDFTCDVTYDRGPVLPEESPVALTWVDYVIFFFLNLLLVGLVILVLLFVLVRVGLISFNSNGGADD